MYNYVRGIVIMIFQVIAINFGALLQVLAMFTIRPVSKTAFIAVMDWLQDSYLKTFIYWLERNRNLTMELTGDKLPDHHENALVLPNHQNHDWAHIYILGNRRNHLSSIRTVLKGATKFIPGFGLSMWLANWPYVSRDWRKDEATLKKTFGKYRTDNIPLTCWIFPEGTRPTAKKLEASRAYAKKNDKPIFQNVMLPRYRGTISAIRSLEGVVDYVYESTIAYGGWKNGYPGWTELLFTNPSKKYTLHMHIKRTKLSTLLAMDDAGLRTWLLNSFQDKDDNLTYWNQNGHFPGEQTEVPFVSSNTYYVPLLFWATVSAVGSALVYSLF
jgi:1-acyl-sn-glycerol-3-phosphate acyltransferase